MSTYFEADTYVGDCPFENVSQGRNWDAFLYLATTAIFLPRKQRGSGDSNVGRPVYHFGLDLNMSLQSLDG